MPLVAALWRTQRQDREAAECHRGDHGAAIRIHRDLGPGLLEAVYERILARALYRDGFSVARQRLTVFEYDGMSFENAIRLDLAENQVIVELKSMEHLAGVHRRQVLTYLQLSGYRIGLLINFGAPTLRRACIA